MLFSNYFVKYFSLFISIHRDWLLTSNAHLKKEYDHSEKPKKDKGPEQIVEKASLFVKNICDLPLDRRGECQTLSVTFTLRTSLKDVRGHSNRTSGDIPTGCPAMFYFWIFTQYLCPLCIYMNS